MKNILKNSAKIALLSVIIAAIFGLLLIIWLKASAFSRSKEKLLRKLPVPIAFVGTKPVWSSELFGRAEALRQSKPPAIDEKEYLKLVFQRLMEEKAAEVVLSARSVSAYPSVGATEAEKILSGWQAKTEKLKSWYFGQRALNQELYELAEKLQKSLESGIAFEELAKTYSRDDISRTYQGDLGYLEAKDLLPEILEATDSLSLGGIRLVASAQGLHLIRLEGKDNLGEENGQRIHLKQIFLPGAGYETWYENQTSKIWQYKLLNI